MTHTEDSAKRLYRADGSPRPVGVIGYPINHSRSPIFQNAAFEYHKLPHRYQVWEVKPEELQSFLLGKQAEDFLGINVTIPHKQTVLDILETGTEEVESIGAANTLFLHEDQYLAGHNTDIGGFLEALEAEGCNPEGKRAMVIGAGGAARAIIYALANAGAVEVSVVNRTIEKATEICDHFAPHFPRCHIYPLPLDPAGWPMYRNPRELIIQATSFGLKEEEKNVDFPVSVQLMTGGRHPDRNTYFFDLLYGETPFLNTAKKEGGSHMIDGSKMLVYQGALSFELWTGLPAPREVMLQALQESMAK